MDVYALYGNSLANNEKMEETEKQLIRRQLFFIQSIFTLFNQEIGDAVVIVVIDIKFKTKYISTIISTIVTKKMCLRNAVQTGFFDCIEDFAKKFRWFYTARFELLGQFPLISKEVQNVGLECGPCLFWCNDNCLLSVISFPSHFYSMLLLLANINWSDNWAWEFFLAKASIASVSNKFLWRCQNCRKNFPCGNL